MNEKEQSLYIESTLLRDPQYRREQRKQERHLLVARNTHRAEVAAARAERFGRWLATIAT
jgi:hypothetical protein